MICTCTKSTEYFDYQMMPFNVVSRDCKLHGQKKGGYEDKRTKKVNVVFTDDENNFLLDNIDMEIRLLTKRFNEKFTQRTERKIYLVRHYLRKSLNKGVSLTRYTDEEMKFINDTLDVKPSIVHKQFNDKFRYRSLHAIMNIRHRARYPRLPLV